MKTTNAPSIHARAALVRPTAAPHKTCELVGIVQKTWHLATRQQARTNAGSKGRSRRRIAHCRLVRCAGRYLGAAGAAGNCRAWRRGGRALFVAVSTARARVSCWTAAGRPAENPAGQRAPLETVFLRHERNDRDQSWKVSEMPWEPAPPTFTVHA